MANEKHDPWALLREAIPLLDIVQDQGAFGADRAAKSLLARIDAALAEHDAVPPVEEKVEWKSDRAGLQSNVGDYRLSLFKLRNGGWLWSVENRVPVLTLDEAKSAAIAAARGMK